MSRRVVDDVVVDCFVANIACNVEMLFVGEWIPGKRIVDGDLMKVL